MMKLTDGKKRKKDKHDRYNRIISILLIVVYITGLLPAQEITRAFDESKNRLDYYLDKAELEYEESDWEKKAETGLHEALLFWESENTYLKENDYEEYLKQKNEAQQYFEMEKNKSYVKWLCDKVNRASSAKVNNELAKELKEARTEYDTTGYSLNEASQLQTAWYEKSENIINSYLDKLDAENLNQLPEIKQRLLEKGIDSTDVDNVYNNLAINSRSLLRTENIQLSKSEGSKLIIIFLEDRESVKAKNAGEAAKIIANDISEKALTESDAAMESLFTNLEKEIESDNFDETDVTNLLENFKDVFNKGLAVWEEAETEFLKSRQEWEKEASVTFQKSEQKWAEAYEELRQKRSEWEESINERIKKTQKEIEQKNRDYETQIAEMYNTYAKALSDDKTRQLQIADSKVSLYKNLRTALVQAKQGIESWYGAWHSIYYGLYPYWKTEANPVSANGISYVFDVDTFTEEKALQLKKELAEKANNWGLDTKVKDDLSNIEQLIKKYEQKLKQVIEEENKKKEGQKNNQEFEYSHILENINNQEPKENIQKQIENLKSLQTGYEWIEEILYYKKQIKDTIQTIYNFTGNKDNVSFKSELELEISEAEKLVQYWEEELYVAQKVEQYAKTTDASRETSEKTINDKNIAELAYTNLLEEYKNESLKIDSLNNEIVVKSIELDKINEQLNEKRLEIETLSKDYEALMALDQGVSIKTIALQISNYIDEYKTTLNTIKETESNISFSEFSKSLIQEYSKLDSLQKTYVEEKTALVEYLQTMTNAISQESDCYYMTISAFLSNLNISEYDDVIDLISNKASDLDDIITKSEYSDEYKLYCKEHYANILKNYISYIIDSEEIKINAANGNAKSIVTEITDSTDWKTDIQDILAILKIKQNDNEPIIERIEKALEDENCSKELFEEDDVLKTLITKEFQFDDDELVLCYNLLIEEKNNEKELNNLLIQNLNSIDEEGKLNNAQYRKNIYENSRKQIVPDLNNNKKAETDYTSVIDYVCGLYKNFNEENSITRTIEVALTSYINAYLYSEAFRYRINENYDEAAVKLEIQKLTKIINESKIQNRSEAESEAYVKNYWTLVFLRNTVNHSTEFDNWFEKIQKTNFTSSNYLTKEQKKEYDEMVKNWKQTYQSELETKVANERKFFESKFEEIEKAKAKVIDYNKYNQDVGKINAVRSSLCEYTEIYSKTGLRKEQIKQELENTKGEIDKKEKEYKAIQSKYDETVSNLENAGKEYNNQIEKVNTIYRNVLEARKEHRAAQAVYDWAESIYLENIGDTEGLDYITPKEKLSSIQYSYNSAKLSLDILKELDNKRQNEVDSKTIKDYKNTDKLFYNASILSYEISEKVQEAYAKLERAEIAYENARTSVAGVVKDGSIAKGVETVITEQTKDGKTEIRVSYVLDVRAETKDTDAFYTKKYENDSVITETQKKIQKTASEIEAEKWFNNIMSDHKYFEKLAAASLYYELFVISDSGKEFFLENNTRKKEDVFKVLEDNTDLSDFSVQGVSEGHGNNVGSHFYDYVEEYLQEAYEELIKRSKQEDIAKCILFRNMTGQYSSNIANFEVHAIKKYAYGELEDWLDDIEDAHWFSEWFLGGWCRSLDPEGIWAEEGSDVMADAREGEELNYDSSYDELKNCIGKIASAKANKDEAEKNYYEITTGSSKAPTGPIEASKLKKTIRSLISKELKDTIDVDAVLSRINDNAKYKDVVEAINAAVSALKEDVAQAKVFMESEQNDLYNKQLILSKMYGEEVNQGLYISEENQELLRELALRASDLTLTISERNEASEMYDELFNSLTVTTDEEVLADLATQAWGTGTYDTSRYSSTLASMYESYIYGNSKIFIKENRPGENYIFEILDNWYINFSDILENRNNAKLLEYRNELNYSLDSYITQNNDVLNQLYDIRDTSKIEWKKAEKKLNSVYNTWKRDFLKTYQKNTSEWKANYNDFLEEKQKWITTMYIEVANQSEYTEEKTAELARKSLEKARTITLENLNDVSFDTDYYISKLLGDTKLSNLENHMAEVETRLDKINGLSAMNTSDAADTIAGLLISQNISSEITSKMEETSSKLAAALAVENINENIRISYESVDEHNKYFENYVKELVQGSGYKWTKEGSTRSVPVDSSLAGTKYETQYVKSYEWFTTALPEVSISTALLRNLEGEALALAVAQDERDLEQWKIRIFGKEKKESEDEEKENQDKGEFYIWVGEAGGLKEDDINPNSSLESNTANEGSGQMGPIMLNFAWNEVQRGKGFAELSKPAWDQKLWSGDFLGFEPPSIRSVACVAAAAAAAIVGAIATPITGGASAVVGATAVTAAIGAAAIGAAITLSNEVLFAMLDIAGEYKTADEIGKQLATSAVTSTISIFGAGAGAAVSGLSGIGGVLAKTGVSAATSVTSTVTVNVIQSGGDWDRFSDSMKSFDTWKGCISSTAGSLVTNSLGAVNSYDGNGIALSGKVFDTSSIGKLNSLAGGLASTAVTYGLTGEATFNVLNIADFINPNSKLAGASSGLLEVTLGGEKGFSSRIGTGGTNISSSSLLGAVKGMNEASKVTDWKYGTTEQKSTLNAINMLGYTQVKTKENDNIQLAKDIWNGELGVEYGDTGKDYGNYTVGDDKIRLSNKLLGGGKEASAKLAAVMSHEGTHAYGNRVEGVAHYAADRTYSQINEIFSLKGDVSFSDQMLAGILDRDNWKENEGDVDHWRIVYKNDGSIGWEWDKDFNFNFEDGSSLTPEEMKEYIQQIKQKREMEKNGTEYYSDPNATSTHAESVITGALRDYIEKNLMNPSVISPDKFDNFILGTDSFADASIGAVKAYTLSDAYEKAKKNGTVSWKDANNYEENINSSMDLMFTGLYGAQTTGLLIKNEPLGIVANNLIGSGSSVDPFFSLVPYSDGTINITGKDGYRIVDQEMYVKLNEGKTTPEYQLYEFSPFYHNGVDGTGAGGIVANENGSYTLKYDNTYGFNTDFYGADRSYQVAHEAGRDTILNFFDQYASSGTYLTKDNGTYKLNGVTAGTQIGTIGSTGIATGNHAHMTVNGSGKEFEKLFYTKSYPSYQDLKENTKYDSYSRYMTGYATKNFYDNKGIWDNLFTYSQQSPYLDYQKILNQHFLEYEYYNHLKMFSDSILRTR